MGCSCVVNTLIAICEIFYFILTGLKDAPTDVWFANLHTTHPTSTRGFCTDGRPERCSPTSSRVETSETEHGMTENVIKGRLIAGIDEFATSLKHLSEKDEFADPISKFLHNFNSIKTDSKLSSALITFGKTSVTPSPARIPVNNHRRSSSGRPKRSLDNTTEHSYSTLGKKRARAPHSLAECVDRNVPLGK